MSLPRRASVESRPQDPAQRIVSVVLAVFLSIALFAIFRPVHGAESLSPKTAISMAWPNLAP
jgi:hypothetical protein